MTLFCANNMMSNIQHGVTSHYHSVSWGATAKSLQGMGIGMGCTIGVPRILHMEGFTSWGHNKGYGDMSPSVAQGAWGTKSPRSRRKT